MIPTCERSHVKKLYRQPAGLQGAGNVIAELHTFFSMAGGERDVAVDSRRLRIEFGDYVGGEWLESRYARDREGVPFERWYP